MDDLPYTLMTPYLQTGATMKRLGAQCRGKLSQRSYMNYDYASPTDFRFEICFEFEEDRLLAMLTIY